MVEEEYVPWGALVVLAAKPHQESVPWHKYQWRLCVSYQKLNQFTRTFTIPIPRCDGVVQEINTETKYSTDVYMDIGYWQVLIEEYAC